MNGYYNKKGKYLGAAENVRVCWNIKTEHEPHIYNIVGENPHIFMCPGMPNKAIYDMPKRNPVN